MRRLSLKKIISFFCAAALCLSVFGAAVSAEEAYDTYNYDRWGDPVPSQAGYTAEYNADGNTIGCGRLNEPADFYISHEDLIYIADTNNDRIVITDLDFNFIGEMKDFSLEGNAETLNKPSGVFVDRFTGYIYIADADNERVIKCDKDGVIDRVFSKPDSALYGEEVTYNPGKVLVDKTGNVYVVVRSVPTGAVMFGPDGEFIGFYGANRVQATAEVLANAFWSVISTDAQRARSLRSTPLGFTNFDIDDEGFIYTVTESVDIIDDVVKKLNPRGTNIIDSLGIDREFTFGDIPPTYFSIYAKNSSISDVDIGPNGEINLLDFQHGRIFQYDKECWLLFIMGGRGDQLGTFLSPAAVESHDDKLYVLDSRKNNITVFSRTPFGEVVTSAANLFNEGRYEESLGLWHEVLKYDGGYVRAYAGIGNAHYSRREYEEAMEYFEISLSRGYYGRAFQGYRALWIKANFGWIIAAVVFLICFRIVYKTLKKRKARMKKVS